MAKPGQIIEEEPVPEGMQVLENASLYVEFEAKIIDTMRSLKDGLDSIKEDNVKLMNAKSDQEEINELILKSLTNQEP